MAIVTQDWLQGQIASLVDQNEKTSAISSTDYSLRLNYLNRALLQWAEEYDWQVLYQEYFTQTSTSTGNASISLPTNFRKLASFPIVIGTNAGGGISSVAQLFPDVLPQEDNQFNDADRRVWILGSPLNTYTMVVKGATLASGASIKVPYYASPQSLASPLDKCDIPNPDYLVQRAIAYLWEGREDPRFPQAKAEADRILGNMIEYENTRGRAAYDDSVRTVEQTRSQYRWGRDL